MSGRIALALAIHNHQPVGNFGWVFEDVFQKAYQPLLGALERHPGVRLSLHYTGPLIEWVGAAHPEFISRLGALVARDQVEVLGGGYYEPVLVSLPERDRRGQLLRMADGVERLFGRRPRGAWLAERVWEPQLPSVLADAGYEWTILDDNHFRAAAIAEDEMWGAYVTEDQGRLLRVFGTEQGLRYRIPFGAPEDVIAHLRDHATDDGRRLGFMGDDGEKFGAWPGTYEHCWGRGRWIDRFFDLLEENTDWLATVTPSAWLDREPPVGRVYVPTASYIEMGEWALPPDQSTVFTALVKRAFEEDLPEKRYLHGGFWRNFQARYREINDLHKQMLRVSAKVAGMPPGPEREAALDHLYRGQSNDCYWHGLFGGIYIVHMRLATCAHLIAAEDLADRVRMRDATGGDPVPGDRAPGDIVPGGEPALRGGEPALRGGEPALRGGEPAAPGNASPGGPFQASRSRAAEALIAAPANGAALLDTDLDGVPEAYLAGSGQVLTVDLEEGAALGSWDLRATRLALASVMRRRPEAYHATLREHEARAAAETGAQPGSVAGPDGAGPGEAPRTIHDIVMTKEPGLSRLLIYDRHERRSGLLHAVPQGTTPEDFRLQEYTELGDLVDSPYRVTRLGQAELVAARDGRIDGQPVRVTKTFRSGGGRLDPSLELEVAVQHRGGTRIVIDLVLEWNVDLAGGGGNPAAHYTVPAAAPAGSARYAHDSAQRPGVLPWVAFGNDAEGASVTASLQPPADVAWYPVETVSNSEAGFERQYQGSCLLLRWPLALEPGEVRSVTVRCDVVSSRDHLAEELAPRP
ncbi:MAG: alpha-amylase/4-alpha-glucanotransferase domain-containing protein [Candidatus Limnocylindrales bacterium]